MEDYFSEKGEFCEHIEGFLTNWEESYDSVCKKLQSADFSCAVICGHDASAIRVLQCCQELGIKVPEQVSIIGCCNEKVRCGYTNPTITSVDMNHFHVGYMAGKYLQKAMNGEKSEDNTGIWITPKGIASRGITDFLATADLKLNRLVKFIEENFKYGIGVADIVKFSGMSEISVKRLFKAHFDRGAGDILREMRMNEAVRLLTSTPDKLEYIALSMGYSSQPCFSKAFQKVFKQAPSKYRKSNMKL